MDDIKGTDESVLRWLEEDFSVGLFTALRLLVRTLMPRLIQNGKPLIGVCLKGWSWDFKMHQTHKSSENITSPSHHHQFQRQKFGAAWWIPKVVAGSRDLPAAGICRLAETASDSLPNNAFADLITGIPLSHQHVE